MAVSGDGKGHDEHSAACGHDPAQFVTSDEGTSYCPACEDEARATPKAQSGYWRPTEPEFVAETLAWCNEIRAQQGQPALAELPKGLREDPLSCPCGRATGLYVGNEFYASSRTEYDADDWCNRQPLPGAVIDFVRAFDEEELPQYDEKPSWYEDDDVEP